MSIIRLTFLALLLLAIGLNRTPSGQASAEEFVWEETLGQAERAVFPYMATFRAARKGNLEALDQMLFFGTKVDAAGALGHGGVLVQLLEEIGDRNFARAIQNRPVRERRMLRELLKCGVAYGTKLDPDSLPALFPSSYQATETED